MKKKQKLMKIKKKRRYLLIDDDATSNIICELNIKKADPQAAVKSYNDPEEGLTCIKEKCLPDEEGFYILFLDVNMPSMTGWEFLDNFQKLNPKVRKKFIIYILTSSIEDFSEKKRVYPEVVDIITKPIMAGKLKSIMDRIDEVERKR